MRNFNKLNALLSNLQVDVDYSAETVSKPFTDHEWWLLQAKMAAHRSRYPGTKVGAVLVDTQARSLLSTGYNDLVRGQPHLSQLYQDREACLARTAHAEANALDRARYLPAECTLYITHPPCAVCAGRIAGLPAIKSVVISPDIDHAFLSRWASNLKISIDILRKCGVYFYTINSCGELVCHDEEFTS